MAASADNNAVIMLFDGVGVRTTVKTRMLLSGRRFQAEDLSIKLCRYIVVNLLGSEDSIRAMGIGG